MYPYRSSVPASLWRKLITNAKTEITLAGYTSYFLWIEQPNLTAALRRKAGQGCKVRFLVGDPDSEVTRHREELEATALTVSTRIAVTLDELREAARDQWDRSTVFRSAHCPVRVHLRQ